MSGQPLAVLTFINVVVAMIFASLIYLVEGKTFSVAAEFTAPVMTGGTNISARFPKGVYVRPDSQNDNEEVSPFRSIPYALWWVFVTMTTVGYGDYAPTTPLGKVIGILLFYAGIILLALPIGVLSKNFEIVYQQHSTGGGSTRKANFKSNLRKILKPQKDEN